jgi:asparaginyl-tRNA synthetase
MTSSADAAPPPATTVAEIGRHAGGAATLRGWVTHVRSSGKVAFMVMRDGTGVVQGVVVKNAVPAEVWETFGRLTLETSVEVTGAVKADARAPGGYELGVQALRVVGASPLDYPVQPKEHGVDFLLDHRHLWLRSPRQAAILRVRHEVEQAIHDFFYARDFVRCDTPILTAAIGERSGLFSTEYFDEGTAYLAQTGQLYGEALAAALGRIYTFGPTFRAEKSKTRRHLTEFWMIEPRWRGTTRTRAWTCRRSSSASSWSACASGGRRAGGAGARPGQARLRARAVRPPRLRRRVALVQRKGSETRGARTSARPTRS